MKTWDQFKADLAESTIVEAHDIELKPHQNGTHYIVHKINDTSIAPDQLKVGEKISDSDVDDLRDGYRVKIHRK